MPDIMRALSYYDRTVKRYFKTSYYEPLSTVNDGPKIRTAIQSNMDWLKCLAKEEEYPESFLDDAELRIARMMATCYIDNQNIQYEYSDERIFMLTYIVCLGFARRGTLTNYFAEAFAFTMGNVIINVLATQRKIMKLQVDDDFNADYLKLIRRFTTKVSKQMKQAEVDPSAIDRYYVYTMFTDAFTPETTLVVFDTILLELPHYRHFSNYLMVAMLSWIENNGGRFETENAIPDIPYDGIFILDSIEVMKQTKEMIRL